MSLQQQLLAKENEIKANSIASSSKQAYQSCLNVYEHILTTIIRINPYSIAEDNIIAFIVFQKDVNKRSYSTLQLYIQAFSSYFENHNLENIVLLISLIIFKSGLRRDMLGGHIPNAKKLFDPSWFELIYNKISPTNVPDEKFFFLMTLSYYCFLRISEAVNLKNIKSSYFVLKN